eukprot:403346774
MPQTKTLNLQQSNQTPVQVDLANENLKLKIEIERLQSLVRNYETKENVQVGKILNEPQTHLQELCQNSSKIENQPLNNSTYLICNELPSVFNDSTQSQINLENTLNLRHSNEQGSLNAFQPQNSIKNQKRNLLNISQRLKPFMDEGISEIRASVNQLPININLNDSGYQNFNPILDSSVMREDYSTLNMDELQKAMLDIRQQERILKDMITVNSLTSKFKCSKIDQDSLNNTKLSLQNSSLMQIQELQQEFDNCESKTKLKINSLSKSRSPSYNRYSKSNVKKQNINIGLMSPVRQKVNLMQTKQSINFNDDGYATSFQQTNPKTSIVRVTKTLTRNISQEANRMKQSVNQSLSRQKSKITIQSPSQHYASGTITIETQSRAASLFQSRRQSKQINQVRLQMTSNPANSIQQLSKQNSKPILNSKTQTQQLNIKKIKNNKDESFGIYQTNVRTNQNKYESIDFSPKNQSINQFYNKNLQLNFNQDKNIQNENFDVHLPNNQPQTTMNCQYKNSKSNNMFNCASIDDISKTEKSLLEEFKRFLQVQQEKSSVPQQQVSKQPEQKNMRQPNFNTNFSPQNYQQQIVQLPAPRNDSQNERSRSGNRTSNSMKHCLNCVQLLSRGLSTAFCKEHQYARSKIMNKNIIRNI